MRQGNDAGTQYRSGIYAYSQNQKQLALASRDTYQQALNKAWYVRLQLRFSTLQNFTTPKVITNSISPKILVGIAD